MKNVARVKEQSSTTGLSSYELASSGSLYRRFRDEFASGERVRYYAASAADFEEGLGIVTYGTPDVLSRDTILRSSQSGAKISWPAGTRDVFIDPLPGTIPMQDKAGSYTATIFDHGSLIRFTGTTATLSLPAAATVGDGFSLEVKNDGTGALTVDPNGSETINGALTVTINAGSSGFIRCNGTAWHAVGFATLDINGLTEDTAPDLANDFLPIFDTSAGGNKKVKPSRLSVFSKSFVSTDQTITLGGSLALAHSLGTTPLAVFGYLVNVTGELGYSTGQLVQTGGATSNSTTAQMAIVPDATNVNVRFPSGAVVIANYSTGSSSAITVGNWRLRIAAYA